MHRTRACYIKDLTLPSHERDLPYLYEKQLQNAGASKPS